MTTKKKTGRPRTSRRPRKTDEAPLDSVSISALQEELQRRLGSLQKKREALVNELEKLDEEIAGFGSPVADSRRRSGRSRRRPKNRTNLVEALRQLLSNRTMSVTEMAEAVQRAGYRTTSQNFRTIVNQTLINNDEMFKRVARGQYTAR